jgi:hypothetical protein
MASYEPPTAVYPIFDSLVFQNPNSASLTIAEADQRYLARQNVATSVASDTQFSNNVSIGTTVFDPQVGTGLVIRNQANSEAIFMDVTDGVGGNKQKIELNTNHLHLYDNVRFTVSSATTQFTTLHQNSATNFDIANNQTNSSTITLRTRTSGGATVTPLSLSSTAVTPNLPITIGYTVAADTQLGFTGITTGTVAGALASGTINTVGNAPSVTLTAGTYLINLCGNVTTSAAAGYLTSYELGISTVTNSFTGGFNEFTLTTAAFPSPAVAGRIVGRVTRIFTVPSTAAYFFVNRITYSGFAATIQGTLSYFQYTRIA